MFESIEFMVFMLLLKLLWDVVVVVLFIFFLLYLNVMLGSGWLNIVIFNKGIFGLDLNVFDIK